MDNGKVNFVQANQLISSNEGNKFVDLAGLSLFWTNAKAYIDKQDVATLDAAKAYTDEKVGAIVIPDVPVTSVNGEVGDVVLTAEDIKMSTAGDAKTVKETVEEHIGDDVRHITQVEREKWNAAKTAIDTFLAQADLDKDGENNVIDTLKEVQEWIKNDETGSADLIKRVGELETEVGDPASTDEQGNPVAATGLYAYADGVAATAANKALEDAKTYADSIKLEITIATEGE